MRPSRLLLLVVGLAAAAHAETAAPEAARRSPPAATAKPRAKPAPPAPVKAPAPVTTAPPPQPVSQRPLPPPAPAAYTDWRPLDAENALVIDTSKGQVVIELRPEFAPLAVARIKRLARSGLYDGLLFHRVIDGFVAQTGDPNNHDGGKSAEPDLPAEFSFRLGAELPHVVAARPQGETEGFVGAQPFVSVDEAREAASPDRRVSAWGAYCAGVVGMGHAADPDTANSEFFVMRDTTRSLDRRYAVVGRVVAGQAAIRALAAGDPPAAPDRMLRARVLADLPEGERPRIAVLRTEGGQFASLVQAVRSAKGADFSICDVELPVRIEPPPPATRARLSRRRRAAAEE
jgi:peptidylprolyl isomerase